MTNEKLREQIAKRGLTYAEAAKKSGVSLCTIAECVRRNYIPKQRIAHKLAAALETTPEAIGLVKQ